MNRPDETPFDVIVVGNGLFGSAATRHLAERGLRVLLIGAPDHRPDRRETTESDWPAHRVYSSHNDAARLTRLQDRDTRWAAVTRRAVDGYRDLESASGISFYEDVGCLIVSRLGGDGISPDPLDVMRDTDVGFDFFDPGDRAWTERWPAIDFPETHYVAYESGPAGYLRPKRLIQAQNVLAERAGARQVVDTVVSIDRVEDTHVVSTADGQTFVAAKVLVTAGGFVNFNGLLPAPVDVRLKSEVIVLGEVSETDALALARFPTVKYLLDVDDLEAIYMTPPVQYEDGRWYIKMGANTRLDFDLTELADIQAWFNTDTDPEYLPIYEPALRALWPMVDFLSVRTQSCLITYSPDRIPVIDDLGDGLFIATAGNGGGAKGSDAWGEVAADLICRED